MANSVTVVKCQHCDSPIVRVENGIYLFRSRVLRFGKDLSKQGEVKCKRCKSWVVIPVFLKL